MTAGGEIRAADDTISAARTKFASTNASAKAPDARPSRPHTTVAAPTMRGDAITPRRARSPEICISTAGVSAASTAMSAGDSSAFIPQPPNRCAVAHALRSCARPQAQRSLPHRHISCGRRHRQQRRRSDTIMNPGRVPSQESINQPSPKKRPSMIAASMPRPRLSSAPAPRASRARVKRSCIGRGVRCAS
jgi:hypothetical protein